MLQSPINLVDGFESHKNISFTMRLILNFSRTCVRAVSAVKFTNFELKAEEVTMTNVGHTGNLYLGCSLVT